MALRWIEGFEGFGSTGAPTAIARKYPVNGATTGMSVATGRIAGYAMAFNNGGSEEFLQTPALTTDATIIVGFALKLTPLPSSALTFLAFYDNSTLGVQLGVMSDGAIRVWSGATILKTSQPGVLQNNVWHYVEVKVVCSATTGSFDVRVNGSSVASDTNVNTRSGSHDYHDRFRLSNGGSWKYVTFTYDDLYCVDGTGSANNTFLGNQKVVAVYPNADGLANEWTTQSGSDHYAMVDETAPNDDTDYVESSTTDQKELWNYGSVGTLGSIVGIQINTDCRETDATSFNLKTLIKSGSTESADAGQAIGSTNYLTKCRVSETDPDSGSAWTASGLDAAQFGVKVG